MITKHMTLEVKKQTLQSEIKQLETKLREVRTELGRVELELLGDINKQKSVVIKPQPTSIIIDDVMVVEVVKPDPTDWYKNALNKSEANAKLNAMPEHKRVVLPAPEMPQMQRGPGVINVRGVMTKAYKNSPASRKTDENADILKNVFIRIYGISDEKIKSYDRDTHTTTLHRVAFDRTFKIGDTVEYDSYNFAYLGTIDSIGEKTVTIAVKGQTRKVQLDLHTFIRRNWDLNLEKIAEERANWYD